MTELVQVGFEANEFRDTKGRFSNTPGKAAPKVSLTASEERAGREAAADYGGMDWNYFLRNDDCGPGSRTGNCQQNTPALDRYIEGQEPVPEGTVFWRGVSKPEGEMLTFENARVGMRARYRTHVGSIERVEPGKLIVKWDEPLSGTVTHTEYGDDTQPPNRLSIVDSDTGFDPLELRVGDELTDAGFLSVSEDQDLAESFAQSSPAHGGDRGVLLRVTVRRPQGAADIGKAYVDRLLEYEEIEPSEVGLNGWNEKVFGRNSKLVVVGEDEVMIEGERPGQAEPMKVLDVELV